MRLHWAVAFAFVAELSFARSSNIEPLSPIHFTTHIGAKHAVAIPQASLAECYLTTLDGSLVAITDDFQYPGFERNSASVCGLNIVVSKDLAGSWSLVSRSNINTTPTQTRLPFTIDIEDEIQQEEKIESEGTKESSEEIDKTVWFSEINRVTRTGQYIDITLNKTEHDELCYFISPGGDRQESSKTAGVDGVIVQKSSEYVSCRITIGPMEASLLGIWTLCGKSLGDEGQERCQRVSIAWNNNSPNGTWQTNNRDLFNHSVSIGGYLRPLVIGSGTILTCHVITPNGEDLVLTSDMEYPKIQRRAASSDTCAVIIGPIEASTLGAWTVYGQFISSLWFNEVRQSMNMFLYDEDNPFGQPYNVTNLDALNRIINLNTALTEEVTGSGNIDSCQYRAPSGQIFKFHETGHYPGVKIVDVGKSIVCRISIGPLNQNMLGEWQIIGKFNNNGIFTERRQVINIIQEDPENPILEDRTIENLTRRIFDTKIGTTQTITIFRNIFNTPQSCHIRTPSGRQYTIMEGFNVPGVTVLIGSDIECGVSIQVSSEELVGEWVLIARSNMLSEAIERRQPFVIYVEEQVESLPREVVIAEGSDLYVRLRYPTEQYDTCKIVGPKENSSSSHEIDVIHNESCGFIVKSIEMSDQGTWEIVYGARIVYRAAVNVSVIAREGSQMENLILVKDREVNKEIGPEDAVYCKLVDPKGLAVFEDFGRCKIVIERVTMDHNGYWTIFVGTPGRVLALMHNFLVVVREAESKDVVLTRVVSEQTSLVLSCSVLIRDSVRACKFRDPTGNILIANQGVGEDRFVVHGSEVSIKSEFNNHECGLRITNPTMEDLGLWRCGIETDEGTHYGFLTVTCPWLMNDHEVEASVITKPRLNSERRTVSAMEGERVTMSCAIQSRIRYCYFRSWNGTVFSISPSMSSPTMEYVGSGFDAGECGIRFTNRMAGDSGVWSCNVGLFNQTEEYTAEFNVDVREPMVVRHYMHRRYGLVVEARVSWERQLEYCRFVRADGRGFTTDSIPDEYRFLGSLESGRCLLQVGGTNVQSIDNRLNRQPWTIAVKIRGQDSELSMRTTENLVRAVPPSGGSSRSYIWVLIILIGLSFILIGVSLGPKKNRTWTYARASQIRNSIRHSFRKPRLINA